MVEFAQRQATAQALAAVQLGACDRPLALRRPTAPCHGIFSLVRGPTQDHDIRSDGP